MVLDFFGRDSGMELYWVQHLVELGVDSLEDVLDMDADDIAEVLEELNRSLELSRMQQRRLARRFTMRLRELRDIFAGTPVDASPTAFSVGEECEVECEVWGERDLRDWCTGNILAADPKLRWFQVSYVVPPALPGAGSAGAYLRSLTHTQPDHDERMEIVVNSRQRLKPSRGRMMVQSLQSLAFMLGTTQRNVRSWMLRYSKMITGVHGSRMRGPAPALCSQCQLTVRACPHVMLSRAPP